ncbi:MAG TPA: hypothetical protein VHX61_18710 [Rhizomicrobium sp.]|nr:hypothetical protein [Rhizomicrobium sp.]
MTDAFRSLAATLALAAMLLRAMLPAGWMPNPDGLAGAPLVICSGVQHAHPLRIPGQAPQNNSGKICPFAAAAHLVAPQLPVLFAQAGFAIAASPPPAVYIWHGLRRARAHSPRAPPVPV